MTPAGRLTVTGDAAIVYSVLDGENHHLLRPAIDPVPEDGSEPGYQCQPVLDYLVTESCIVGIGACYWHFVSNGDAHSEQSPGGGDKQVEKWERNRYGVFLQVGFRF